MVYFFQVVAVSILLYGCTTWMVMKCMEKKLGGKNTKNTMCPVLNISWKWHPTKQHLYGHLSLISQTIQVKWTRHAKYCWWSKNKLKRDILLWAPTYGCTSVGCPGQFCADTRCSLEDLSEAIDDTDGWWERVMESQTVSMTGWWWWYTYYFM